MNYTNYIYVSENNILDNIKYIQSLQVKSELIPVLKSNAYGHGLVQISKIINKSEIKIVAVNSFPEYQIVKKHTNKKILILGETIKENYNNFDLKKTSFCVYNYDTIHYLKSIGKKIKVHLFLNTGMNREGIMQNELQDILKLIKDSKIQIEGVCSHFSSADELDFSISETQIDNFKKMYKEIESTGFSPKYRHIGASAGLLKMDDDFFNAYRPGFLLYGYNPLNKDDKYYKKADALKPALEVFSTIISIQKVKKGEGISYNKTFTADNEKTIGIIPFGYYEGLNRELSNNWKVKLGNKNFSIAGNVCMNLTCIDFNKESIRVGDIVKIISSDKQDNNIYKLATKSGTIVREVLTRLSPSIYREII